MTGFELYIKELLNERGINENDKKDLEFEIKDHLMLLKNEYLDKGVAEQQAIELSIKDFGDSNFIGNGIKVNLPSHNKIADFSIKDKVNCLFEMLLIYFIFRYFWDISIHNDFNSMFFYVAMAIPVVGTSFIFINKKLMFEKNKIRNILFCNILFFTSEKIIMSGYSIFRLMVIDKINSLPYLLNSVKNSYLLDWRYIGIFLLSTLGSIILTKLLGNILLNGIRNTYNYHLSSMIIFVAGILLFILYSLILCAVPYRLVLFIDRITNITGFQINTFNRNPLFILINNKLIIPNIGLLILLTLFVKLIMHIRKKGLKSIL